MSPHERRRAARPLETDMPNDSMGAMYVEAEARDREGCVDSLERVDSISMRPRVFLDPDFCPPLVREDLSAQC